jgi:hypothetical protein
MSAEQVFRDAGRLRGQVQALLTREGHGCPSTVRSALQSAQEALTLALQTAKAAADEEATRRALAQYILRYEAKARLCDLLPDGEATYVIGRNQHHEAVCLIWPGEQGGEVSRRALAEALQEADKLGCARPTRVYGYWCRAAEVAGRWTFCQLNPGWVHAALEERQTVV